MKKLLLFIALGLILVSPIAYAEDCPTGDTECEKSAKEEEAFEAGQKEYKIPFLPQPEGLPGLDRTARENPEKARQYFITDLFPRITKLGISLIGILSLAMLFYSGVMYFTTFGETDKADSAKKIAIYAIVGIIVAMLSFAIVQIVGSLPFT